MFYGVGGGNLDGGIVANILQALEVGSSDKVKMTFQYRFSSQLQKMAPNMPNMQNVRRFTADENSHLKGAFCATDLSIFADDDLSPELYNKIKSSSLGDSQYVMASDTALVSFLNWSKKMYPKATKTILILNDHGGGWDIVRDGYKDMKAAQTTKGILFDDNVPSSYLSLGDVKRALSEVGGVDVLYTDACVMSTWENLTGYSSVAKYFLGSFETAPGVGGNYHYLLDRLAASQVDDAGMESALRKYADDVVDKWWTDSEKIMEKDIIGDIALYNLQEIGTPLDVIKQAYQALTEKWQSTTPIPGMPEGATLGNEWRNYIRKAVTHSIAATSYIGSDLLVDYVPLPMQDWMNSNGFEVSEDEEGRKCYSGDDVLRALKLADMETLDPDYTYVDDYLDLWYLIEQCTFDSYSFADILRVVAQSLRSYGLSDDNNPFAAYQKQYIDALKSFGYIRCTHPLSSARVSQLGMIDYAYNCCSPGLFVFSFNETTYNGNNEFSSRLKYKIEKVDIALKVYQSSDFDQRISWSNLLRLIDVVPSIITNPAREEYKE